MAKHSRAYLVLAAGVACVLWIGLVRGISGSRPRSQRGPLGNAIDSGRLQVIRLAQLWREGRASKPLLGQNSAGVGVAARAAAEAPQAAADQDRIADEFVVRFATDAEMQRFIDVARAKGMAVLGVLDRWHVLRLTGLSREDLAGLLKQGFTALEVENNISVRAPPYPSAWRDGMPFRDGALNWLGVKGDNALWGEGITVAILDTGVGTHPALDEASISRISLLPEGSDSSGDYAGHATAIASLLAGSSTEVHGVSPAAHVLSIEVMGGAGVGDAFTLAQGVVTAVDQGAAVLNISLGSRGDSSILRQAIEYAIANGVLVVAATGNDGADEVSYPARYEGVIAVSAVDANGQHADYANRGDQVAAAAPGEGVYAAWTDSQLVSFSGTSAAVPFVAGALAGILPLRESRSERRGGRRSAVAVYG